MSSQLQFLSFLRSLFGVLLRAAKRLPALRYGPRVADAQQALLVRELCKRAPPQRPGDDQQG
jgi:hypothetical protein